MESKKDIYNLWVQYTTKNEEYFFRQFVAGFVSIWESQLALDLGNPPSLTNPRIDTGPHLSRLPDELLAAIGKFLYIAKEQAEKNSWTPNFLLEVELLIKCLTVISRNFDNIPFIASCDYINHGIAIAAIVIHKLSEDPTNPVENGISFIHSFCRFLEVLYDPYFTWRHFLHGNLADFSKLPSQPALLHVEVIPFIYDCFQTPLMFNFPELSTNLIHVLGSVIFGAQRMILSYVPSDNWEGEGTAHRLSEGHNGLRAICPATVSIIMGIISKYSLTDDVRSTALHCFVAMVQVLHRSSPDQRQIELTTILQLCLDAIKTLLSSHSEDISASDKPLNVDVSSTLCDVVSTTRALLSDGPSSGAIAQALVETNFLNVFISLPYETRNWCIDHQALATECTKCISKLLEKSSAAKERMSKTNSYDTFITILSKLGHPSRQLLIELLQMAKGSRKHNRENEIFITNAEMLVRIIRWMGSMKSEEQEWIAEEIGKMAVANLPSKSILCQNKVIEAVCDTLSNSTCLTTKTATELINILETLSRHSIRPHELKLLFLLLRPEEDLPYRSDLLQALAAIARQSSPLCHSYIDIQKETDGINVPEIRKWIGSAYGFSFHCWVRLDTLPESDTQNFRRQLFNLLTSQGTGLEVFIQQDGTLVVAITTRREFLTAVVSYGPVGAAKSPLDNQWHCVTICLAPPRRPFAHNNISVFIDGTQRLGVSMKFPAFSEPFSYCTIGSMAHQIAGSHQRNDYNSKFVVDSEKGMLPTLMEKGFFPSLVSHVPSYFTLPLRSSSGSLDPQVRSFPVGMQDSVWGAPSCMKGQLALACLLQEPLSNFQAKSLFELGPQLRKLLSSEEVAETSELSSRLVFCFSPSACWDGLCVDLAPGQKYSGNVVASQCRTQHIQDVINGIGGVHSLLPLLENAGRGDGEEPDMTIFTVSPTAVYKDNSPKPEDLVDWEVLPSSAHLEWKLDQNPVAMFLCLLRNMTSNHILNQEQLLRNDGVSIIGALLVQCRPTLIDVNVLMAIQLLIESFRDNQNPTLLKLFYHNIVFNFKIWSKSAFHIRIGHIQYISSIIKEDRKYFRKKIGIQFILDVIRQFYASYENLSAEDAETIRISLLDIVKFYIQKEVNVKEVMVILSYMASVREEALLSEMLNMLLSHMESKHCRDQIFLLMYEPQGAELLYALLQDRTFGTDFKQKLLKFLYVLLRTDRINSRHKLSLRLQDHSGGPGLYPGLIASLQTDHLAMEVAVMLLDQMLLGDTEGSYAGALALLYALALADIDVKLEMARKLLATTFINLNAPFLIAKQVGWQDSITRLLIKRPISTPIAPPPNSLLAVHSGDFMTFDETTMLLSEHRGSTSGAQHLAHVGAQVAEAATALEHEIKELAVSVGDAVVENLTSVAGNFSSVYSVIRQKTNHLQDTLGLGIIGTLDLGLSDDSPSSPQPSPRTIGQSVHLDTSLWRHHSGSSSSEEDLSPVHLRRQNQTEDQSLTSLISNETTTNAANVTSITEALALQQMQEDKAVDKEENLCYIVSNILFTVLWRGVEGSTKDSWKERGQVMACINLLGLNNELYCSHLQLKLRILEMGVQASLLDLGESEAGAAIAVHQENAAQLMRMVFDLIVLDPNEDDSKKCSVKLLDGVLALLDTLLVFQDSHGEDWGEMARLSLGLLVRCASHPSPELVAMATARLHAVLHTRRVGDVKESAYMMYELNSALHHAIEVGNAEQYAFLMPVMKALLDKSRLVLSLPTNTPDLPLTSTGPVFFNDFQMYSQSHQWQNFVEKKIKPQHAAYMKEISTLLTEPLNTFWAECYEACKKAAYRRQEEQLNSKQRFHARVLAPWRARQAEEAARLAAATAQHRSHDLLVERRWRRTRQFLMGPRGPWRQRNPPDTHWNLCHHENTSRMRLKLEPALHFDPHTSAANLRDNTGNHVRKHSVEFSLPITPAALRAPADEDGVPEEELRMSAEPQQVEPKDAGKEKIVISQECEMITLMSRVKGRLDVTTSHLVFHDLSPVMDDAVRQDAKWPLVELREVHLRKYNLRRSALEIFLMDQTNYFINFTTKTRNKVFSRILSLQPPNILYGSGRSPAELLRASGLTQRWQFREISNFDYLMQLNTIAGRTYNDLSQYPVFPWILADYQSEILDLSNPASFRDLSKPIGVVNPKNELEVRTKYESFEDPTGIISKFHYGTHYSNSAGVLHYLLRVEPFTSLHIELQSGRFDVADRQFHSIPQTWKLLMDNPNDVKELTPEFFYFPEFLKNLNKFDLGLLQITKERVDDVMLPKWALSAEDFIALHRRALESEYVSAHIHEWIDLIFGCKQKGPKAVEALNVFYYCSYEGAVDLDAIANPVEREAVEGMINNFGQTPSQLLRDYHPRRLTIDEVVHKMLRAELRRPDLTMFIDRIVNYTVDMSNEKDPIVYLSMPRSPPRSFLQTGPDSIISISRSGALGAHAWLPQDKTSPRGFFLEIDPTLNNPKNRRRLTGPFHPSVSLDSQLFAVSLDGRLLYSGGLWDSSLRVYSVSRGKVVASVIRHFDIITCVALDHCGSHLVTGSRDCTCVLWALGGGAGTGGGANVSPRPLHTLYGHDDTVSCVAIMTELDMVVSGSLDGTVNVYTIQEGQFIRCLEPAGCSGVMIEVTFMCLSQQGHVAFSAKDQTSHSVHVFSVNGAPLGSKYVSGRVTGLAVAGDNLVIVDDAGDLTMSRLQGLKPVFDIPLHVPIQGVVVAPGNSHVLCPLRDGRLSVLGPPSSRPTRSSILTV